MHEHFFCVLLLLLLSCLFVCCLLCGVVVIFVFVFLVSHKTSKNKSTWFATKPIETIQFSFSFTCVQYVRASVLTPVVVVVNSNVVRTTIRVVCCFHIHMLLSLCVSLPRRTLQLFLSNIVWVFCFSFSIFASCTFLCVSVL